MKDTITTQRLIIRPLRENDRNDLFENIFHDKEVLKTFVAPYYEKKETLSLRGLILGAEKEKRMMSAVVLKENNEAIGLVIQNDVYDPYHNSVDLGIAIARKCWNQGYGEEILREVMNYFFSRNIHRISGSCFKENLASKRIMEKCGMIQEGEKIDEIFYLNEYRSSYCFYALNPFHKNKE